MATTQAFRLRCLCGCSTGRPVRGCVIQNVRWSSTDSDLSADLMSCDQNPRSVFKTCRSKNAAMAEPAAAGAPQDLRTDGTVADGARDEPRGSARRGSRQSASQCGEQWCLKKSNVIIWSARRSFTCASHPSIRFCTIGKAARCNMRCGIGLASWAGLRSMTTSAVRLQAARIASLALRSPVPAS